ncbi:MAG: YidC/Oxa1 family membrane protein insertase [Planctomycetes bacterium]|nr:YidC/Oxa1 family membrane protein insertase [Planctomycetota bacterium]
MIRAARLRGGQVAGLTAAFTLLGTSPLWAIPSPDIVINFAASAAQALGLLTVVFGSFAYSSRKRARASGRPSASLRWPFRVCLAALLVSIGANVFQFSTAQDDRNRRLRTNLWRSSTEAGKKVGDVNLKTLSVSEQEKHPQAIQTEDLVRWLAEGKPLNLIDVREPEEVEMGTIAGAWHRRYPDLFRDRTGLVAEGKETVLLCESGNRSGELAGDFLEEGVPCRFLIGGYEKWVAEGRPLENEKARAPGEIRDIPDYPGKWTLLDTPDVAAMLERENVLFVDLRYPGDFELGHLPDAVCVPMRKMPSDELWSVLKGLPKRPIVAPCYDKRSSFYAMILGLRLHRLGYDFRGRYTVPHEFAVAAADKAWVAQWREAQEGKTLFAWLSGPLHGALAWLRDRTGSLALAIVALVLALRLLVLPVTVKADRDQLVQRRLAPAVDALRRKTDGDSKRFSRALMALYRREGLRPVRNMLGTAAQVILFIAFFTVVNAVSADANEALLWLPSLGTPDPWLVLPLAVGALISVYLRLGASKRSVARTAAHVLAGAALFLLTFRLRSAVNLYLTVNLALLLVQSCLTRRFLARPQTAGVSRAPRPCFRDAGVVLLRLAHRAPGTGNKAARLGRMLEVGLPVPDGFVLTDVALAAGPLDPTGERARQILRAWRRIRAVRVAVRSSGLNEDGSQKSYAGVFESILDVTLERLLDAIEEVRRSLRSERASAYSNGTEERGAIVVQKMVPAEYAGVLFTEHPGSSGAILVEMVEGLGDALVSGTKTPRAYRFGRATGRPLDPRDPPPIDVAPLLEIARRVEEHFGRPQDIEWAYSQGEFYVLQARDITRSAHEESGAAGRFETERKRVLEAARASRPGEEAAPAPVLDEVVLAQNELSELLPRPTPLSLSFMEALWAPGGSTDLACRALGIPYDVAEDGPPYVVRVFGSLYVNRREAARRMARGPGFAATFRLTRGSAALERELRDAIPQAAKEARLREALDLSRFTLDELLGFLREWKQWFIEETYVGAEKVNIAADFYLKAARIEIERRGLDPSSYLGQVQGSVVHKAMSLLPEIGTGERPVGDFLDLFGHRAPFDYELSQPRYRETPDLVMEMAMRSRPCERAAPELAPPEASTDRVFLLLTERARRFQVLKEEAKHHALRELATLRKVLVEIGARVGLDDGIFHLTLDEVLGLKDDETLGVLLDLAEGRRQAAEEWKDLRLPTELTLADLESLSRDEPARAPAAGKLRGVRVSGSKEVVGPVRVVASASDIGSFQKGEVLVARFTDPTWTPLFPIAGGVVTEVGGWLSHAAILAREYGVTAIVGAAGALSALKTGETVRLRADGLVEKIDASERRRFRRVPASARVALLRQGEIIEALLRNLSRTGALVESDEELEAGQGLSIRISQEGQEIHARVVRRDGSGGYALDFATPLQGPLPGEEGVGTN